VEPCGQDRTTSNGVVLRSNIGGATTWDRAVFGGGSDGVWAK
jgi:hypothetical protein